MPTDLAGFVADQQAIADLLGATLLFVESPETGPANVAGIEIRHGDLLRARLRLQDGHEMWGAQKPADLIVG